MIENMFVMPERSDGQSDRDYNIASARQRLVSSDSWRQAHLKKNRNRVDKRMSLKEAVQQFVNDGDIVSDTGFTWVRGCIQATIEMMRQRKQELTLMGAPMGTAGWLTGSGIVKHIHNCYTGAEMRGIDRTFSRNIKSGAVEVLSEWSHGSMSLGFKAAQLGIPYCATKIMLGSDMLKYNPYLRVIHNDFMPESEDEKVCLVPALYPDVVFIHVQQADKYGNARIWGPILNDAALAVAARKVVITCEEVIPEDLMQRDTAANVIPFIYVDAVVEMPFGNLPGSCPGYYYWHREWWEQNIRVAFLNDEAFKKTLDKWVYGCRDHFDFIDKLGGGAHQLSNSIKLTKVAEGLHDIDSIDYKYDEISAAHPTWRYPWEGGYEEELSKLKENLERLAELDAIEQKRQEEKK